MARAAALLPEVKMHFRDLPLKVGRDSVFTESKVVVSRWP